ncbi:MAG: hypothetical protein V4640_13505 [Verrucomicrobiota bacterium]
MSRRSRRGKVAGPQRWMGKALVALLVVGGLLVVGIYAAVRSYLHSESFRKFLSAEAGAAAGVSGEFAPFAWDGMAVETDSFHATGKGMLAELRADGLHTEIGLGGLKRGVWEVRGSSVRRLEVTVDATREPAKSATEQVKRNEKSEARASRPSWLPSEVELEGMEIAAVAAKVILKQGEANVSGLSVKAEPAGAKGAYRGQIDGGTVRLPFEFVPEIRLERALLRYQDKQVFLTQATAGLWQDARVEAAGEWDGERRKYSLQGEATGIRCEDLLGEDWSKRVTGGLRSDFSMGNSSGEMGASGTLTLENGVVTALPVLDALAAYADTRRFRVLALSESHGRWSWKKGELRLSEMVLAAEGLVRLEGGIVIRGKNLDGVFRLGLAPGTLARIPGAETDVFVRGERGLLWAPLRITGTLDDPKEDLTDRLIAAAGLRMFELLPESGEKVIKFTRGVIGEIPDETLDKGIRKGVEFIDKGGKTVREVSGILDDVLGTGLLPRKDKKDDP